MNSWRLRFVKLWQQAMDSDLSPKQKAEGFALGALIAFLPIPGFQLLITLPLCQFLGRSKPMAILANTLVNPFGVSPHFVLAYWVGAFFWTDALSFIEFQKLFSNPADISFSKLGMPVLAPLWIGGVICGIFFALVSKFLVFKLILRVRRIK